MYDKLIKRLRECTAKQNCEKTLWHEAADAIEELQVYYELYKDLLERLIKFVNKRSEL